MTVLLCTQTMMLLISSRKMVSLMMWFFVADLRKIHDSFPNSYMSLINLLQKLFPFIIDLVIFSSDLTDNWINSTLMCYLPPFIGKLFILMIIPVNILSFCFPVIRCSFF